MTGDEVDIFVPEDSPENREPLMIVEGPLQELFVPETVILGSLSYHLTEANQDDYEHVDPDEYREGIENVVEILVDLNQELGLQDEEKIGFADFGARHYHPAQQRELAKAAQEAYQSFEMFEDDVVGHSTPVGVEAINEMLEGEEASPSGTMNHAFVIPHASEHGKEDATLEAFKNYHDFFQEEMPGTPTPVLIDTANAEIDDTLAVCEWMEENYGEDFDLTVRIDTNGANYAQGVETGDPEDMGVSVEAAKAWNEVMIEEGYRDNINFLVSSGKGYVDEMEEWKEACIDFYEENEYKLFDGVGAGSFDTTDNLYTTSDIVRVDGEPLGKDGRLGKLEDEVGGDFQVYVDQNMVEYNSQAAVV